MSEHPYVGLPRSSYWRRAVSAGLDPLELIGSTEPLLRPDDHVMSAGSCFAANMVPWLEDAGFEYLRTEPLPPAFAHLTDNLGYDNFSARYGNLYTARQLLQLLDRALERFTPAEDRWHIDGAVVDPFRPGLAYPASSDHEFDELVASHLHAVDLAFRAATVLVFTLGLTETWLSALDGAVYPVCPGTVAGDFDPDRHVFRNFTAAETEADLRTFVARLRKINPSIRVILTVSPVPLVATYSGRHVLSATTYSKSALRVAAEAVCEESGIEYFPAYELVTGPQAPHESFEADRRSVSSAGIAAVMGAFLGACALPKALPEVAATDAHLPAPDALLSASRLVSDAECDEALLDA